MPDGLLVVLATATPRPTPRPVGPSPSASPSAPSFDPNDVTPGTIGFVVTFAMVIVVVFLLRDLTRRVRRINLRGEEAERRAAEQAAAAGGSARATPPGGGPGAGSAGASPGGPTGPAGPRPPGSGRRRPPSLKPPGQAPTTPS